MMKKIVFFWIIVFTMICSLSFADTVEDYLKDVDYFYQNEETGYYIVINDEANLLNDSEIRFLSEDLNKLTEYGNIVFLSTDYDYSNQKDIAHDYYYPIFGEENGSVLLIDMFDRIVYIYSDGENLNKVTESKSEIVTDNIYSYLSDEKYYAGSKKAFDQMYSLLGGKKIPEPMRYIGNILISAILGFFIMFIIAMKTSKISSANIPSLLKFVTKKFDIKVKDIKYIGQSKRVKYVPKPVTYGSYSSSSSRSMGHSAGHSASHSAGHSASHSSHSAGHSSHSSGGGGGHRF